MFRIRMQMGIIVLTVGMRGLMNAIIREIIRKINHRKIASHSTFEKDHKNNQNFIKLRRHSRIITKANNRRLL